AVRSEVEDAYDETTLERAHVDGVSNGVVRVSAGAVEHAVSLSPAHDVVPHGAAVQSVDGEVEDGAPANISVRQHARSVAAAALRPGMAADDDAKSEQVVSRRDAIVAELTTGARGVANRETGKRVLLPVVDRVPIHRTRCAAVDREVDVGV